MSLPLVECVPNFSEARRPEVVEAIEAAIRSVSSVQVLDRHSDLDHNRTVITFAGPPEAVEEAAYRAIVKAAELIDLNQHRGEHPRIGATDVMPFVPLSGVSMQECIAIARRLGERVGTELGIPVYLYEQAATRPERQSLENIRRGEYEVLKTEIGQLPAREPDFGPAKLGPAGATVIGARPFLVAYNVYLTSDEVAIAEKIARAVRHSSGGLRFVKALGLLVEGRAQVSMNLTDFRKTPLARVVELIRREAARYGVGVHHSELVGLIPQEALLEAAVWYLQLDEFESEQVLEQRLFSAFQTSEASPAAAEGSRVGQPGLLSKKEMDFLEALASAEPAPGGGSAAAAAAAAAAALVAMVARLTIGRKKYAEVQGQMQTVLERAEALREECLVAVKQDAQAYQVVMEAYRLPKDSPEAQAERSRLIQSATLQAAQVPLEVSEKAVSLLELATQVVMHGNLNAISDGGTAVALAQAALTGAGLNVRTNIASLEDKETGSQLLSRLQALEETAAGFQEQVRALLRTRGGLSLE